MFQKAKHETNGDISLISSVGIVVNDGDTNKDEENIMYQELSATHSYKYVIVKAIFYAAILIIYVVIIIESYLTAHNVYHVFSWLATLFSVSYVLCIIHTLSFSTKLCNHTIEYELMDGMILNYVPSKLNINYSIPWKSISHMSHIRGSSIYKWHTTLMSYGSFSVTSGAIIKICNLNNNTMSSQQIAGVYLLLCGGIGGLIVANFEVYSSPSFSRKYNLCCDIIHTFGALTYALIGNLSFAMYNNFSLSACFLLISTLFIAIFYRINRMYQYNKNLNACAKNKNEYGEWVHNMSVVNIALEFCAIIPSAIAMCGLLYQFGNEM